MLITVIGRGHSGTRAISHTLYASGVFMGDMLNDSGDLLPPEDMYEACRVMARHVGWKGGLEWDFSRLHTMPIPGEFTGADPLVPEVASWTSPAAARGWKIPETTLVYPWIARMFPDIKYIYWIRNPRDCIIGGHLTDDLADFGIRVSEDGGRRLRRAISWKYQYDIVKATPRPANWIEVRFEDFVLHQEKTLARLEEFLGMDLARIIVRPDAVGRWKQDQGVNYFDFFAPAMAEYRYPAPDPARREEPCADAQSLRHRHGAHRQPPRRHVQGGPAGRTGRRVRHPPRPRGGRRPAAGRAVVRRARPRCSPR